MPIRQLIESERRNAAKLLDLVRAKLITLSRSDPELLFAYRRKVYKELTYDERGKPMHRRKIKTEKWKLQKEKCADCGRRLPFKDSELDRIKPMMGYTIKNVRVVHHNCHRKQQEKRRFA